MRYYDGRGPLPPAGIHQQHPWKGLSVTARRLGRERTALYRFYAATGELLYIGITNDLKTRWGIHAAGSPWWYLRATGTVEWFPTRGHAELAERLAIKSERPIWNQVHNGMPLQVQQATDRQRLRRSRPEPADAAPSVLIVDHRAAARRLAEFAATVDVRTLPWRKPKV